MIPPRTNIPYGLCQCGCKQPTKIAPITSRAIGWVKGEPTRFIIGHANRHPRADFSDANPFKIAGVYCKLLPLSRGLYAIINASDYEWLSQWHWYALYAKGVGFYAVRHRLTKKKITGKHIYLHRFILGLDDDDERVGDHKNGNTLDYRRKNLRAIPFERNTHNHKVYSTNTSGREGVSYVKSRDNWSAQIKVNGKTINLGRRKRFKDAVALREAAEEKYRKGFRREDSE